MRRCAAVIVCAAGMVEKITHDKRKPIEALGIGASALEGSQPHLEVRVTTESVRQVYETTGVKQKEIDLFFTNDFIITSHL